MTVKAEGRSPGHQEKCGSSEFQCQPSACLHLSLVCDGKPDCADGADEGGQCSSSACRQGQCFHACYPSPRGPVSGSASVRRRLEARCGARRSPSAGLSAPHAGSCTAELPGPLLPRPVLDAFCRVQSSPFPLSWGTLPPSSRKPPTATLSVRQ